MYIFLEILGLIGFLSLIMFGLIIFLALIYIIYEKIIKNNLR